jgi:hypothetical protein
LGEIRDKLKENQSLRGQLRVKLKKFRTNDFFEKKIIVPTTSDIVHHLLPLY